VLHALSIPYEILLAEARSVIVVPAEFVEQAKYELWQYEQENRKQKPRHSEITPVYQSGIPGVATYVAIICLVAWFAGVALFNRDWFAIGRVDGELIRDGEWWRTITALTLHSGARHLAGNIVFGVLFGLMAGRLVGSGIAWFGIVVASSAANFLNTSLLESAHRAIGASTAVFAALGLVSGFVWRAKLMAQDRWPYRLGPYWRASRRIRLRFCGRHHPDHGCKIPHAPNPAARQRHRRHSHYCPGVDCCPATLGLMAPLVVEFVIA